MIEQVSVGVLEDMIAKGDTVVADFFASWCGPCKMMHPVLEDINNNNDQGLKIAQINVDDYPEVAANYGVQSIPNMILFKDGKPVNQVIGFMNKDALLAKLSNDLN